MSFYDVIQSYRNFDFDNYLNNVSDVDVISSLNKDKLDEYDLLNLLSKEAVKHLELMAEKANKLSIQYFGKTVCLYTPMYIANYCINKCVYCGYNVVEALKNIFPSIGIEVYPMEIEDYKHIVDRGAEGLTVYQEVYDEAIYKKVHLKGPKSNYRFRLDAPERGAKAGMRSLSIGALLGLNDFRKETFFTLLHGQYLRNKYPKIEMSYSTPRIRPFKGCYENLIEVSDVDLVQAMICMRLFDSHAGINLSTREGISIRKNLIPLGVTKLSAGVSTDVGGHTQNEHDTAQFKISDESDIDDIKEMLKSIGYQHIFKDWERF